MLLTEARWLRGSALEGMVTEVWAVFLQVFHSPGTQTCGPGAETRGFRLGCGLGRQGSAWDWPRSGWGAADAKVEKARSRETLPE